MNHTVEQLVEIALSYHAPDKGETGAERQSTPEARRQRDAHVKACASYRDWLAMLQRLEMRFPGHEVHNRSIFRQGPNVSIYDLAYSGTLSLTVKTAGERYRYLGFMASIVVPYYVVFDLARLESNDERIGFELDGDDLPIAREVVRELELTFPGYSAMTAEAGKAIVPGVSTSFKLAGEATVYDCLFSDDW